MYLADSNSVFVNVTIADNAGLPDGAGMSLWNCIVDMKNCILWSNIPKEIQGQGLNLDITHSTIANSWPGTGNLSLDPLFATPGLWVDINDVAQIVAPTDPNAVWLDGDYHLKSAAGRWDPLTVAWVIDDADSPAIDAGDLVSDWSTEPIPNGDRINQGAYGGTSQASLSNE